MTHTLNYNIFLIIWSKSLAVLLINVEASLARPRLLQLKKKLNLKTKGNTNIRMDCLNLQILKE
jgi:hypothetical protein